jgi:hypothetical protein
MTQRAHRHARTLLHHAHTHTCTHPPVRGFWEVWGLPPPPPPHHCGLRAASQRRRAPLPTAAPAAQSPIASAAQGPSVQALYMEAWLGAACTVHEAAAMSGSPPPLKRPSDGTGSPSPAARRRRLTSSAGGGAAADGASWDAETVAAAAAAANASRLGAAAAAAPASAAAAPCVDPGAAASWPVAAGPAAAPPAGDEGLWEELWCLAVAEELAGADSVFCGAAPGNDVGRPSCAAL